MDVIRNGLCGVTGNCNGVGTKFLLSIVEFFSRLLEDIWHQYREGSERMCCYCLDLDWSLERI